MKPIHFLAIVPFIGILIGPIVHNQVHPFILGMPFPLGWITVWVILTAIIMGLLYLLDPVNKQEPTP